MAPHLCAPPWTNAPRVEDDDRPMDRAMLAYLLHAQRYYFGAHTHQRVDRAGTFHTRWSDG
jgi:hypothetical protein